MTEIFVFAFIAILTYLYVIKLIHVSTIVVGSSVSIPVSKLRFSSPFMLISTAVKFALPIHTFFKSKTGILKWKRRQSTRSGWSNKTGYLSKFSQKAEPDPFCMNEPHLYTLVYGLCYERKEWFLLLAHLHIEVFDVGCANPKRELHGLHPRKHSLCSDWCWRCTAIMNLPSPAICPTLFEVCHCQQSRKVEHDL